jgi:hypothetical protein
MGRIGFVVTRQCREDCAQQAESEASSFGLELWKRWTIKDITKLHMAYNRKPGDRKE